MKQNQNIMTSNGLPYYFFVDDINENFPGFSKVIDKIRRILPNVVVVNSLENIDGQEKLTTLGIVASNLYLKKFKRGRIAFIMDSPTLCFSSMVRFYIKRRSFFNMQMIGSILRYIKYYFIEKKVIRDFDKIIVVSEHDAEYMRKKFNCSNIEVVTNGVDFPDTSRKQNRSFDFRFGILSYWGVGNHQDVHWFLTDYLPKLKQIYPEVKIVTAGRGADEYTLNLFEKYGVEHLGEVDDLWDFFNNIDVYITTIRKECGILNKVLDAMAYKKIVVGLEHNMYPFRKLTNGYFTYANLEDLIQVIEVVNRNSELVNSRVDNAHKYLLENHNWQANYNNMKLLIDNSHMTN